jgi:hypothetical protein|nr:MAG TPA: helix-turn-helix domain protein [Caudoviricetes sp.]
MSEVESLVYTVSDVAKLFKCTETSVYNMRNQGILHQIKGITGVRFSKQEVESLIGLDDEYTPMAYRKLKAEVESLKQENNQLKNGIRKITSQMLVITGDLND